MLISSIDVDGFQNDVPEEHLGLTFARIRWTWSTPGHASVTLDYDLVRREANGVHGVPADFGYFGHTGLASQHQDWVPFTDFSASIANSGTIASGTGAGAGKSTFSPLRMTTDVSETTLELMGQLLDGRSVSQVEAHFLALDPSHVGFERLRYELEHVLVTSVALETTDFGTALGGSVGLQFGKVSWAAKANPDDAEIKEGWDLETSQKL